MNGKSRIKVINMLTAALLLGACQNMPEKSSSSMALIQNELKTPESAQQAKPVQPPPEVQRALLPHASTTLGRIRPRVPTYDVSVNKVPARQFFMSLVEGTPDNMVVHPDVSGNLTLNLKNVSTEDVMSTVRDVYGYEYRHIQGIYQVFPARMRSQVFKVNYLDIERQGGSRTRVSSGQITQAGTGSAGSTGQATGATTQATAPTGSGTTNNGKLSSFSGTQVTTRSNADLWKNLEKSLNTIIGDEGGRKVITNPLAGTVLVHASPRELMDVEEYLNTLQTAVNRQVIIEAKILEVQLNDNFQTGINWASLIRVDGKEIKLNLVGGGGSVFSTGTTEVAGATVPLDGLNLKNLGATAFGGVFGVQADLGDFNAFIELLEGQGDVHVLSSPRVSTVNNQKAIIKVGTDEYFVTDVDLDTQTTTGTATQSADIELTPFFSGVALDVTPQIDEDGVITLHVHPAISDVTEETKDISVTTDSQLMVPLAKSTIRESDTIVRARNGQVVIIGGLMQDQLRDQVAATPFLGELPVLGHLFRQTRKVSRKTELVILLKPIVVNTDSVWAREIEQTSERMQTIQHRDFTPW